MDKKKIIYTCIYLIIMSIICAIDGIENFNAYMIFSIKVYLFISLGLLISSLIFVYNRKYKTAYLCWILLIATFTATLIGSFISDKVNIIKNEGAKIIRQRVLQTLQKYHAANKIYPKTLDELYPNYFPKKPLTPMGLFGRSFSYRKEKKRFYICYEGLENWYFYDNEFKKWFTTDESGEKTYDRE